MPPRKRTKTSKRSYRRNYQSAKSRRLKVGNVRTPGVVYLGKQLLPPRIRNTLKFCGSPVNIALTGAFGKRVFTCNGIFQTDVTAAAGQARGFDQFIAMYEFFTVYASRIKVEYLQCQATTSVVNHAIALGVFIDDNGSTSTTIGTYGQAAEIKTWRSVRPTFTTNIGSPPAVYNSWKLHEAFGPNGINNSLYRGTSSANPTIVPTYVVCVNDFDDTPGTTVSCIVTVEYDVEWDSSVLFAAS